MCLELTDYILKAQKIPVQKVANLACNICKIRQKYKATYIQIDVAFRNNVMQM